MRVLALGAVCALAGAGCFIVLEDDRAPRAGPGPVPAGGVFEPFGEDVELRGEWVVDGAPATAESCAALGISSVAIVLFADDDPGRTRGVTVGMAACAAGEFDSAPARILRHGNYLATYRAINGSGLALADSVSFALPLSAPLTRAELEPVDFTSSSP